MKQHKWILIGWCLLLFMVAPVVSAQTAEPQAFHIVVVRQIGTSTQILDLKPDGTLTFVTELVGVVLWNTDGAEWTVQAQYDIAPSPDGQNVAFTALSSENEAILFVVSLNPLRVNQYAAPGIASLQWSPANDALLLSGPNALLDSRKTPVLIDTYVFDLVTHAFTLVIEESSTTRVSFLKWLPDGQNIVYVATSRGIPMPELFKVNRNGSSRQRLTNLKLQATQSIDFTKPSNRSACRITQIKWSRDGRLYYVLDCFAFDRARLPSLFSVDMAGNNRLELDLASLFPDELEPESEGFTVVDFFPDTANGSRYLVINTPAYEMQVLRLNTPSQVDVIARLANYEGYPAALSPDGSQFAVTTGHEVLTGSNPVIALFDLTTGQIKTTTLLLGDQEPCGVQWQNDDVVLAYQGIECVLGVSSFGVHGIFVWDTANDTLKYITPEVGGAFSYTIPLPEVPPLSSGG